MKSWYLAVLVMAGISTASHASAADAVVFTYAPERECSTSAGVYLASGEMVRTLWSLKKSPPGQQNGTWDGLDDFGRNVPPGPYEVRIACSNAAYSSVGTLGNSGVGQPMQAGTDDLIIDPKTGDIYTANNWEEAGQDFRKMDAEGRHLMDARFRVRNGSPNGWPIAVAIENGILYCSVFAVNETVSGETRKLTGGAVIRKFTCDKGDPLKFPTPTGYIRVKMPDPADKEPFEHQSLHAITICGDAIVAADRYLGKVFTFDKTSGAALGEFALERPVSVITDAARRLWIAHSGNQLSVMNLDGKVLARPAVAAKEIVCIRFGPGSHLWVADQTAGQLQVYKIEAGDALTFVKSYGKKAEPGQFEPLAIGRIQSFDVMPDGGFVLAQTYGHGSVVTRFTADGKPLWQQVGLEFCTNGTYDQHEPDLFISSLSNAYRLLDLEKGTWRFEGCLYQGPLRLGQSTGTPRILELNKNRYYYELTGDQVRIFRLDGLRMVLATIVGVSPRSWDKKFLGEIPDKESSARWVWHDANGDGQVQPEEISRTVEPKLPLATFSCEVDQQGALIIPNHNNNTIYRLARAGFDAHANPTYNWADLQVLVPADDTLRHLRPMKACPLPDGGMYVLQMAEEALYPPSDKETGYGKPAGVCWMGGWVFSKYDRQGKRLFTVPLPDHCTGLDWVPNVGRTEEKGLVAGVYSALQLYHYSPDGLLLGVLSPKHKTGWLDHNGSVSINRNPKDGVADLFAEESLCNRISWYRLDDRDVKTLRVAVEKKGGGGKDYASEAQFYELFRGGQEQLKRREFAAAIELMAKALDGAAEREKPFIHNQLGEAYRQAGRPDEAIREYLLVADSPTYGAVPKADTLFVVSRLLQQQKKPDEAIAVLKRVADLPVPPDRQYVPQALLEMAQISATAGKPDEARRQLQQVKDYFRSGKPQHPQLHRQAFIVTADLLRKEKNYPDAIKEYEQTLQIKDIDDTNLSRSESLIAECDLLLNDAAQAAAHFTAAGAKYPKAEVGERGNAFLRAGDASMKAGDKDAAKKLYQQAIDLPGISAEFRKAAEQKLTQTASAPAP